ncbi:hypothetical protein C7H62_1812 [Mesoflavibacter sp. HG96]|nr:hypothetical protein C7H62_1812 [Mesoflavibacter sp. HG96]QIJ92349.1 hypothetical protein C7H56_1812 [Mesoflavibacter sp. HG37]
MHKSPLKADFLFNYFYHLTTVLNKNTIFDLSLDLSNGNFSFS